MPFKVVGGFVLTFEEAEKVAADMRLEFGHGSARIAINDWIAEHEPRLWPFRLQHIMFRESGQAIPKLIFPTAGTKAAQDPGFRYSEHEGNSAKVREAARRLEMPNVLFANFMTIFNPEISFIDAPRPRPRPVASTSETQA